MISARHDHSLLDDNDYGYRTTTLPGSDAIGALGLTVLCRPMLPWTSRRVYEDLAQVVCAIRNTSPRLGPDTIE